MAVKVEEVAGENEGTIRRSDQLVGISHTRSHKTLSLLHLEKHPTDISIFYNDYHSPTNHRHIKPEILNSPTIGDPSVIQHTTDPWGDPKMTPIHQRQPTYRNHA